MSYYRLNIKQVCRPAPGRESWSVWERVNEKFETIRQVQERLIELYGKVPYIKGNEIYRDTDVGARTVGFHYSYWEYHCDRSLPPDAKFWATDWVEVSRVRELPVSPDFLADVAKGS